MSTKYPVRYSNGAVKVVSGDMRARVFGRWWSYRRTYANQVQAIPLQAAGNNWLPRLWGARIYGYSSPFLSAWNVYLDANTQLSFTQGKDEFSFRMLGPANYRLFAPWSPGTHGMDPVLYMPDGQRLQFYGVSWPAVLKGKVKEIVNRNGHKDIFSYNADGQLTTVLQTVNVVTAGFTFTYLTDGYTLTLANGSQTLSSATSHFYNGTTAQGNSGDLQRVVKKEWHGGSGGSLQPVSDSYYTYYKWGDWDPGSYPGLMKYRLEAEALARLGIDPATATDAQLAKYATQFLRYDEFGRVIVEVIGGDGIDEPNYEYNLAYHERGVTSSDFNVWVSRTTETQPDGSQTLAYCNFGGQVMLLAYKNASGTQKWYRGYRYSSNGGLQSAARSSAIASYSEANDALFTLRGNQGLIYHYITEPQIGALSRITRTWVSEGDRASNEWIKLRERQYAWRTPAGGDFSREMVVGEVLFQSSTGDLAPSATVYDYEWHSGTYELSRKTTTLPTIPGTQNGSNTSVQSTEIFDLQGQMTWFRDERKVLSCHRYDAASGARTQTIEDVDTSVSGLPTGRPTGWTTSTGLHLITDYENDVQGRRTQELGPVHKIDLNGTAAEVRRATWTVYLDAERKTYEGTGYAVWNSSTSSYTYTLINPVTITQTDAAGQVTDEIVATRSTSSGRLTASDAFAQSSWVRWRQIGYDASDKQIWERLYVDIPTSGSGTIGTNYHETTYAYDAVGRLTRTKAPGGTITRTVFNVRGWDLSTWVGTNDTGATNSNPAGSGGANNMVKVTEKIYDGGTAGGDGNITELKRYTSETEVISTQYSYDFRNRRTSAAGGENLYISYSYDNATRLKQIDRRSATSAGMLLGRQTLAYDNRGRFYEWVVYAVTSSGVEGNALKQMRWYDPSGNVIKQRNFNIKGYTKSVYDAVGRLILQHVACGVTDGTYAQAGAVSDDYVLAQSEYRYDAAGNVIFERIRERNHGATGTGTLQGPSGTQPCARVSYTALYSDVLGRGVATAAYGTGAGTEPARTDTVPFGSDTCLVSLTHYNDRGENDSNTDPKGSVTLYEYDDAGQVLTTVENYHISGSGTDQNKTTHFVYNGDGNLTKIKAQNILTGEQVTEWIYGTTLAESGVASGQIVRAKKYPNSTSSSAQTEFKYSRLGQLTEIADQAGTVHKGEYDALGRLIHDRVTEWGSGVDDTVQRISISYNARGLLDHVTSHSNSTVGQGTVVNDVFFDYNEFNQLVLEQQAHAGAVAGNTPQVEYSYASGNDLTARRTQVVYPNGRSLIFNYDGAYGLDNWNNRISGYSELGMPLVAYTRRGINSTVKIRYIEPAVDLTYIGSPGGDGGDQYAGLDRFSRIIDVRWLDMASTINVDRTQYGFDRASNQTWRHNATGIGWDEAYTYDGLYQLDDLQRGTLSGTAITGTPDWVEDFTYDPTGNWINYLTKNSAGTTTLNQDRTHDKANQIATIAGSATTAGYDPVGNMTTLPISGVWATAQTAKWDAWNRLVELRQEATLIAEYRYDGLCRRISKASVEDTMYGNIWQVRHYYYSDKWQVLEERLGNDAVAARQFVWGARYRDDLILRDRYDQPAPLGNEEPEDSRLYVTHDQWHVTAVLQSDGTVFERYAYNAFGQSSVLSPSYTARATSVCSWETRYGAYRFDSESGLYQVRYRYFHPTLGRWLSRDPIEEEGGLNLYGYVSNGPTYSADPMGLQGVMLQIPPMLESIVRMGAEFGRDTAVEAVPRLPQRISPPLRPIPQPPAPVAIGPYPVDEPSAPDQNDPPLNDESNAPEKAKQTCCTADYNKTKAEKKHFCDQDGRIKGVTCNENDTAAQREEKKAKLRNCIKARTNVARKCYGGGDRGHIKAINQIHQTITNCDKLGNGGSNFPPNYS